MSLRTCPMCKGRHPNNVFARILSTPCDFCGGLGVLDTESSCKCGRPAVRKLNENKICTRYECAKEVLGSTAKA